LSINFLSMIVNVVAFLGLLWILKKYAFGPIFGILDKRKTLIQEQIESAEKNQSQAAQLLEEQKLAIQNARKDALEIMEQARSTSSKQADDLIRQAKAETERLKQEAMGEIENEKNKAIVALKSQVSAMSVLIASKIIEKQVDAKSQEELIEKYLKEVGGNL
jgi:F-type H+-transporting ATPase subunit b